MWQGHKDLRKSALHCHQYYLHIIVNIELTDIQLIMGIELILFS